MNWIPNYDDLDVYDVGLTVMHMVYTETGWLAAYIVAAASRP